MSTREIPNKSEAHQRQLAAFSKSDSERSEWLTRRKKHNKFLTKIFGTKRPTAGIIKQYYLNLGLK